MSSVESSEATTAATAVINTITSRSFEENVAFIQKDTELPYLYHIKLGFVPNMKVINETFIRFWSLTYRSRSQVEYS